MGNAVLGKHKLYIIGGMAHTMKSLVPSKIVHASSFAFLDSDSRDAITFLPNLTEAIIAKLFVNDIPLDTDRFVFNITTTFPNLQSDPPPFRKIVIPRVSTFIHAVLHGSYVLFFFLRSRVTITFSLISTLTGETIGYSANVPLGRDRETRRAFCFCTADGGGSFSRDISW